MKEEHIWRGAQREASSAKDLDDGRAAISSVQGWMAKIDHRIPEAISAYQHSLDVWRSQHGEEHRSSGWGYLLLGKAKADAGQSASGTKEFVARDRYRSTRNGTQYFTAKHCLQPRKGRPDAGSNRLKPGQLREYRLQLLLICDDVVHGLVNDVLADTILSLEIDGEIKSAETAIFHFAMTLARTRSRHFGPGSCGQTRRKRTRGSLPRAQEMMTLSAIF